MKMNVDTLSRPVLKPRGKEKSLEREAAVERGLLAIFDSRPEWVLDGRVHSHIHHLLEAYRRCGKDVFSRPFEHKLHGYSYQWSYLSCHGRGHKNCAWWSATHDWDTWSRQFDDCYGSEPLAVLKLHAPGSGPKAMRWLVGKLFKRRPLQPVLGRTIGFLMPGADGYSLRQLVRLCDLHLAPEVKAIWEEIAGENASIEVIAVEAWTIARELAAELRCQAEQAIPLLVDAGKLEAKVGLGYMEEELKVNHVVFGPGFRSGIGDSEEHPDESEAETGGCEEGAEISAKREGWCGSLAENSADNCDGLILNFGETLNGGDDMCRITPEAGRFVQIQSWQPCKVCGDPACGQRPASDLPILGFWEIERLLKIGVLTPTGKEGVLLVVQPEKLPPGKGQRSSAL
jgi:hypothetical protein